MKTTIITAAIIAIATSTSATAGTVTQKQIETDFSNNSTEAQRDFAWEEYEGESVSITGTIYDVDVPSWLVKEYTVTMEIGNGVDIFCRIPEAQKSRVRNLRADQTFTCNGTLRSYTNLFGSTGISVASDSDTLVNTPVVTEVEAAITLLEAAGYTVTKQ